MAHTHEWTPNRPWGSRFALAVILNLTFVCVEVVSGIIAGSMALVADAGHNLGDVLGLLIAWGAAWLAGRNATEGRTYGFRKLTIMAPLVNALILMVALGVIVREAVERLITPVPVQAPTVILVGGIGVLINTLTALLFLKERKRDINIGGAFLHMAADAAISLGVVAGGLVTLWTGIRRVDPLISLGIAGMILAGAWSLLRRSSRMAIDAVPEHVNLVEVRRYLEGVKGVSRIHDLHIWSISSTEVALTVHLVVSAQKISPGFLANIREYLKKRFGIDHTTIQVEESSGRDCPQESPRNI